MLVLLAGCQTLLDLGRPTLQDCGATGDSDGDGVCDPQDRCAAGPDRVDGDSDGVPDACDACPIDGMDDSDGDGACDSDDPCPVDNPDDTDGDGACDSDDPCPVDNPDDTDSDTVCDSDDVCPGSDDTQDVDMDAVPDACDVCPLDAGDDTDGDGLCDSDDLCPVDNPDDSDSDGVCDSDDNCPAIPNPAQADADADGAGDACDSDPCGGTVCEVSCNDILMSGVSNQDGLHTIDVDGPGGVPPFVVFCDMTTDGGGWTLIESWDREADPATHTLASFQASFIDEIAATGDPNVSFMTDFVELADRIRWSDFNATADALSFRRDVIVPNGGELQLDVHYVGNSMENSAVWMYATAGGVREDILCHEISTSAGAYTAAEFALIPYPCPVNTPATRVVDSVEQRAFGGPITAFTLFSLHYDSNLGDNSNLFRLILWVR